MAEFQNRPKTIKYNAPHNPTSEELAEFYRQLDEITAEVAYSQSRLIKFGASIINVLEKAGRAYVAGPPMSPFC